MSTADDVTVGAVEGPGTGGMAAAAAKVDGVNDSVPVVGVVTGVTRVVEVDIDGTALEVTPVVTVEILVVVGVAMTPVTVELAAADEVDAVIEAVPAVGVVPGVASVLGVDGSAVVDGNVDVTAVAFIRHVVAVPMASSHVD